MSTRLFLIGVLIVL